MTPRLVLTSRPAVDQGGTVGQPLADDALQGLGSAVLIVNANCNVVGIAEVIFREIAMQVLFSAVLMDALHATLEDAVVALNAVGGDLAARIFVLAWLTVPCSANSRPNSL